MDTPASGSADVSHPAGRVDVSVIVPTRLGGAWLEGCLRSLAGQTLAPARYEVLLVQYGPEDGTRALVDRIRRGHPKLRLRRVAVPDVATRAGAKNVGLGASRGRHVVIVHDEDRISAGFLAGLAALAKPADVIALGLLVDVPAQHHPPTFDTPRLRRQLTLAGRTVPLSTLPSALTYGPAKLVSRSVATEVGFDADLPSGEDAVFWGRVALRPELRVAVAPVTCHAVYYRTTGRNAQLPDRGDAGLLAGIERVAALPLDTPIQQSIRRGLVADETSALNRYLRTYPAAQRQVIMDRRRLGVDVRLPQLNRGVARDLAVLYRAVPFVDTSANVAARRIRSFERIVDVVSCDMGSQLGSDPSAELIWQEFVDQKVYLDSRPADIWWPGIAEFCHKGLAQIRSWEKSKGPYRSVYSRTMHPASHVLAAWYKIRRPEVTWTAEFSDPILHNVHGDERQSTGRPDPLLMREFRAALAARNVDIPDTDNLHVWIETLAYALADRLLFTNTNQLGYMLDHFADRTLAGRARALGVVSPQPTLPPAFYAAVPSDYPMDPSAVHIGYFGAFYATRGLTEVVAALTALDPQVRARVRLHVFTGRPGDLAQEITAAGLDDVVVTRPYVGFLEFLNLTTQFDVLLVNDARTRDSHDRNPYLPSKYSDYQGSGRPVWGVVEEGSVLSGQPLAYVSRLGDVAGAQRVLEQIAGANGRPVGQSVR